MMRTVLVVAALCLCRPLRAANELVLHEFDSANNTVYSVEFSPDGKLIAGHLGATVHVWDVKTGKEIRKIAGKQGLMAWSIAFSPDSKLIYGPEADHSITAWDIATGNLVRSFKEHTSTVWQAAVSPDGKLMASGSEDRSVRIWDTVTGNELHQLTHDSGVWPFQFSHDGSELVSIGSSGTLYVWDTATGKQKKSFATVGSPWPLALASDGRTMAVVQWQQTDVGIWDLKLGKKLRSFETHSGTGWNLAFTPDGRTLAAGGPDFTLCLRETVTGKERLRLGGHKGNIDAIACSPDGRVAVTAGRDGKVMLWDISARLQNGKLTPEKLSPKQLDERWTRLADNDAVSAYQAMWSLTAGADTAVPFLAEKTRTFAARKIDVAKVETWLAELDDNNFDVREKASVELTKLGAAIAAELRKALAANPSEEKKRRLDALIADLPELTPESLTLRRAVETLEWIGTKEARAVLERIAENRAFPDAADEAKLSLRRLAKR